MVWVSFRAPASHWGPGHTARGLSLSKNVKGVGRKSRRGFQALTLLDVHDRELDLVGCTRLPVGKSTFRF